MEIGFVWILFSIAVGVLAGNNESLFIKKEKYYGNKYTRCN